MNTILDTDELDTGAGLLNSTLANHLHLHLPSDTAQSGEPALPAANSGIAPSTEDGVAFYNLLMRYVNLLEAPDHGGWTLEEDNAVREAVTALSRSGWKLHLPHGIASAR